MKKVLFMSNHFVGLYYCRKELIQKLAEEGYDVYLSIPESEENKYFTDMGCKIIPTEIDRRGVNPVKDLKLIRFYKKMMKELQPDVIFSYTIKPNIYGCMASNKKYKQICNITGTGATFLKNNALAHICKFLYKISVKNCYKVFFQNTGDRDFFIKNKMVRDNYDMLPGSGCDLAEHPYSEMQNDAVVKFIFVGRVMKLKGIDEYLECAKYVTARYPNTKFYIAGWNEELEYKEIVAKYQEAGYVEYLGYRKDVAECIKKCHCTILPSHGGEGVPNVLLETSATGRICISSDINGSKDVIEEGKTGYLFKTGNAESLIEQVEKVIAMLPEQRTEMGKAGRAKIEKEFDRQIVVQKYCKELESL